MTQVERVAEPLTAIATAERLLDKVPRPAGQNVEYRLDWAGPIGLPLEDEQSVQASCGIMHVHGRASGRPAPLAVDYASTVAGLLAAQGVTACEVGRARGGRFDGVRTSVGQAALLAVTQYLAAATARDSWRELDEPGMPTLRSADDVLFEIETLDADVWREFWAAMSADRAATARGWYPFQQRFGTATCALPDDLRAAARRMDFAAVRAVARETGMSVLPVRESPDHPNTAAAGGDALGWATTVLPGAGVSTPDIPRRRPLEGVRVVEATRRVQGPLAGHLLRLLGADVLRVEPPGGDPLRGVPPMSGGCSARFSALNSGKDVVEVDIKSEDGRRMMHELISQTDVFVHNWAPGKAAELGLDAENVIASRPGLVYGSASGWGSDRGPNPPVGTDFLVQAASGLAAAARPAEEPPAPSLMTLTDVLGGLILVQGVLAGLLEHGSTGRGVRVDSSLLSAAGLVRRPRRRAVWTPTDRPVTTADGYLWLAADSRNQLSRIASVVGVSTMADPGAVAAAFAGSSSEFWLRALGEAGLSAMPVCTDLRALASDPRFATVIGNDGHASPLCPWEFW